NMTFEATFALLGFSDYLELQTPLFFVFLAVYSFSVVGNLGMTVIIKINPKLHTPMYFFLSHLSFVDFCYSSIIAPKMLVNLVVEDRTISFSGCMVQFFSFFVMSQKLLVCSLTLTCSALKLSFRGFNTINHFFCELSSLISLSCSDSYLIRLLLFTVATFNEISTLLIILTSYVFIVATTLKMLSVSGCRKTFSTCASHLTAITIFHGTILFLYCVPNSKNSRHAVTVASVFYTVVIPMLNPLIYSLRNKDVKDTIRKIINMKYFHIKHTP
uniref:Olfactory receptor family 5 subfamily D member 16 n=1 Tax=Saimiri boliviensis boliviensis TaxID=39432 RepID=A0A2K6S9Z1_SAIBB